VGWGQRSGRLETSWRTAVVSAARVVVNLARNQYAIILAGDMREAHDSTSCYLSVWQLVRACLPFPRHIRYPICPISRRRPSAPPSPATALSCRTVADGIIHSSRADFFSTASGVGISCSSSFRPSFVLAFLRVYTQRRTRTRSLTHLGNRDVQGGPKKWGHRLMTIILSNLNRFQKCLH